MRLSERLTKECDRITSRQYMGADRWVNSFAHSPETRLLLADAAALAKRYEDAPVAEAGYYYRPTMGAATGVMFEGPDFTPLAGQRVRILLDTEG